MWHVARWARCVAQVYLCVCVCLPPSPVHLSILSVWGCVCVCARALLCLHRQAYLSCGSVCLLRLQWVCVHITPMSRGCCPRQVGVCVHSSWRPWQVGRWEGRLGLVRKYVEGLASARLSLTRMFQSLGRTPAEAKTASEPHLFCQKNFKKHSLHDKYPGNKFPQFYLSEKIYFSFTFEE